MKSGNLSPVNFYRVIDEIAANSSLNQGLSATERRAVAVYLTERNRGSEVSRVFEYTHPAEYAELSKVVADFSPGARTMSDVQAGNMDEAEQITQRAALYKTWLESRLQTLADAVDEAADADRRGNVDRFMRDDDIEALRGRKE